MRRFRCDLDSSGWLCRHLQTADPARDWSSVALVRLIVAMRIVGARRVKRVRHLAGDPVIARAGLLHHPRGRATLTPAHNLPTGSLFERIATRRAAA